MLMRIFLDTRWAFSILVFLSVGSSVYAQALYGGGNASQNLGGNPTVPCNNTMVITPNPVVTYEAEDTAVTFSVNQMFGTLGGDSIRLSYSTLPNFNIQSGGGVWWGDNGSNAGPMDTERCRNRPANDYSVCLTSTIQTHHHTYTQSGNYWVEGSMGADFKQNAPPSGSKHCEADANVPVRVWPTKPVAGKLLASGSAFWSQEKPLQRLKVDNPIIAKTLNIKGVSGVIAARAYIDEAKGTIHLVPGTLILIR
jgi:hypothetical protein